MNTLKELEIIRKEKRELEEKEKQALKPVLTNFNNVLLLKEWFEDLASKREGFSSPQSIEYRQRFLFIVTMLYCPGTLLGDPLIRGLRDRLSELFKVSPTIISHSLVNVYFYYCRYKDFREDIDYLYSEILFRIELNRLK